MTAIPGIVFSGSMDGGLRAAAADDGQLVWSFDTNKDFQTVNGVPAKGGAMDGPGAAVANGMVFINSGYVSLIGRPGNVLLAFGVDWPQESNQRPRVRPAISARPARLRASYRATRRRGASRPGR